MGLLESWEPWETTLPAGIDRGAINDAITAAQIRLVPCEVRAFAVLMDRLLGFAATFSIKVPDPVALTKIYRDALNLPADLMADAVGQAVANWRWGNRLPLPAELSAFVAEDMVIRQKDLRKLRLAERKAKAGGCAAPGKRKPGPDQVNTADLPSGLLDAYWRARLLDKMTPAQALAAVRGAGG